MESISYQHVLYTKKVLFYFKIKRALFVETKKTTPMTKKWSSSCREITRRRKKKNVKNRTESKKATKKEKAESKQTLTSSKPRPKTEETTRQDKKD